MRLRERWVYRLRIEGLRVRMLLVLGRLIGWSKRREWEVKKGMMWGKEERHLGTLWGRLRLKMLWVL
jgi:hypothetical protein